MGACNCTQADDGHKEAAGFDNIDIQPRTTDVVGQLVPNATRGAMLSDVPILMKLSESERDKLGGVMEEKTFQAEEVIFNQGDPGSEFFIIVKGKVLVSVSNKDSKTATSVACLGPGDYFGEAALLNNDGRGATITVSDGPLQCLVLRKDKFLQLLGTNHNVFRVHFATRRAAVSAEAETGSSSSTSSHNAGAVGGGTGLDLAIPPVSAQRAKPPALRKSLAKACQNNLLFSDMDQAHLDLVVDAMYRIDVSAGASVITQGAFGFNLYVIESGVFSVWANSKKVDTRSEGVFGELALMYNQKRSATVTADQDSVVWAVDRYTFRRINMNTGLSTLSEHLAMLSKVELLSSLTNAERGKVAEALEKESFRAGESVVRQGEEGDGMYIIVQGHATVIKNGERVLSLNPGDFFGERALMTAEPRAATVVAETDITVLRLDTEAFQLLLGPLKARLQTSVQSYEGSTSTPPIQVESCQVQFSQLSPIATLGQGSFGHVRLVRDKQTDRTYALKAVSKHQVVQTQQQRHILDEKNVMMRLQHPFCVRLFTTFKDKNMLYFLLEPALGGELFTLLRKKKRFSDTVARFYLGQVVSAFDYLHAKNYVYRDLKPENLLVTSDGYLKITDFGFAKEVHGPTWTLCGTPEYLSPEIVRGRGHGKGVDWWTVGVLLFEMLASYTPFCHEDQMKMYDKIVRVANTLRFPSHMSQQAKDLITKFLSPKPTNRLGIIKGGTSLIKEHEFFAGFDWQKLEHKQLPAPHTPKIKNSTDHSNFQCSEKFYSIPYVDDGSNWDAEF